MPSATVSPVERIPAWKRLGLKLKSAQAPQQTFEPPVETDFLKRTSKDSVEQRPSKRAKNSSTHRVLTTSAEESITPNVDRKKSVTFTPDTKVEDGDSIKQLFGAWVIEQKAQDPSFQPKAIEVFDTPEPSEVEEQIDTTLSEKERRVKRVNVKTTEEKTRDFRNTSKERNSKPSKLSKVEKTKKAPPRPFLLYLKQYHESRGLWKFNKNHQNHFLKHVFNVNLVPSDHAHLIYEYVRGLQGGVRTRLRDQALAIKVKDQEDGAAGFPDAMSDRDRKQQEYESAMKEYVATMTLANASSRIGYEEGVLIGLSDAAMSERMAKRMRAERMLREVGTPDEGRMEAEAEDEAKREASRAADGPKISYSDEDSQKGLRMTDGSSNKVVRKRKQRTSAADDDTSSSDDSSHSESSSDDDSVIPPRRASQVEESSSSSSSSSSDSDSDEDEEDEEDEDNSDESGSD